MTNYKNKCFWSHNWNKWIVKDEGNIESYNVKSKTAHRIGKYINQERECLNCGRKELNTIKSS